MRRTLALVLLLLAPLGTLPQAAGREVLFATFETDAEGWSAGGQWTRWHPSPMDGTFAFHYGGVDGGFEGNVSYRTGLPSYGVLQSPPVHLRAGEDWTLSFRHAWEGRGCPHERPVVEVHASDGRNETLVDLCAPRGAGTHVSSLDAVEGTTVVLRFVWDTLDAVQEDLDGWWVDDVAIASSRPWDRDLVAASLALDPHPWNIVEGTPLVFVAGLALGGPYDSPFAAHDVAFILDGAPHETVRLDAPATTLRSAPWVATPGTHTLTLVVDAADEALEPDEANNVRTLTFTVAPARTQNAIAIRGVERLPHEADPLGAVWYPSDRFLVTLRTCNGGNAASDAHEVVLQARPLGDAPGSRAPRTVAAWTATLAPGVCATQQVTWEARGAVGDFSLEAAIGPGRGETRLDDNRDARAVSVLRSGVPGLFVEAPAPQP